MAGIKAAASAGFDKAKAAAATGAKKMKAGASVGIKWFKKKCSSKWMYECSLTWDRLIGFCFLFNNQLISN